jgi:hypothetical protein
MIGARAWLVFAVGCGRVAFDPIPDGATIEGMANVAFVTSSQHDGALGGLAGADAICAQRAGEGGLAGTFVAWLSTPTSTAFSRIAGARGWRLVDGTPLADDPTDFATLQVLAPFAQDEHGNDVRATRPTTWTGTNDDGTDAGTDCNSWTTNAAGVQGLIGDTTEGARYFTASAASTCNLPHPLYCLQIDQLARVAFAPVHARFAFVTDETWQPNPGGVASADATCARGAARAGLPGDYLATLPTASTAIRDRFDLSGPPWARVDFALLAPTAPELFSAATLANFPDLTATGRHGAPTTWGGDPTVTAGPCTGWTVPDGAAAATIGASWTSDSRVFNTVGTPCDTLGTHLLCLQR